MKGVLLIAAALLSLAKSLDAATFYVATTGNDADPGSEANPFRWPQQCVDVMSAGDTCIVKPGTYSGGQARVTIAGKSGVPGNPITLRAETPAVLCSDPVGDPDGCEIDTAARTVIDSGGGTAIELSGADADFWDIEGFELVDGGANIRCQGTSIDNGPDHINIRYIHSRSDDAVSRAQQIQTLYCSDIVVEHSYFFNPHKGNSLGHDYGIQLSNGTRNVTLRNLYFAGEHNHNISVKQDADDITIERIVCEGVNSECIHLGQNTDNSESVSGGASCNVLRDDGTTGTVFDRTSSNITLRRVFARPSSLGGTSYDLRFGLVINNASDVDAQDIFVANPVSALAGSAGFLHWADLTGLPEGQCGVEPGNNSVRGMIIVAPQQNECLRILGNGYAPSSLSLENVVCHNPVGASRAAVQIADYPFTSTELDAFETASPPVTTYRNYVHNDCSDSFTATTNLTQQTGAASNCGAAPAGALTSDPEFAGPANVPVATLDFGDGQQLWDWAGRYQPIIDQFDTQQAAFEDAGTGTAPPCTGAACDIGANEFFGGDNGGGAVWVSCAVYGNGSQVFGPYTNPSIPGRPGLVIDVDCNQKRVVVGRCDDPEDPATCDTDIYIHKTAQRRKKRTNEEITLNAGTAGAETDTTGTCWRTRATFDFTESLEVLTGFWVRYEIDPDGGTHDCRTCPGDQCPQWAWQGAEE